MHRQEETARAAAARFGLIEREIGVGEELVDGGAILGSNRYTGAAAGAHGVLVDLEILRQPVEHRIDDFADHARVAAFRND